MPGIWPDVNPLDNAKRPSEMEGRLHGRASGTRTHGLFVPNEARYQLRYSPLFCSATLSDIALPRKTYSSFTGGRMPVITQAAKRAVIGTVNTRPMVPANERTTSSDTESKLMNLSHDPPNWV